ncbi:uncharacterized protein LAESUDRAFT_482639 [Laetiporus sulphureus 93-53]|uniref:Uncharacterized protein n=1 Tax=Laetiporus sulphureus 93-53 TaxID=1314785 RepID=A0A165BP12_9APHY|nr:uncharacterized protein LAESUDRAFT_482639 [Laetiporus sulphureus 93-53]KZT01395.1 hypothetical protein LAESUDRAFT_482639 [Laetiporus sulphureus 93-53]
MSWTQVVQDAGSVPPDGVLEMSGRLQPWPSPAAHTMILGTIIPTVAGLLMLFKDVSSFIPIHKALRRTFRAVLSPFRNFLTLDDLEECPERAPPPATWKRRALVLGAALECMAWIAAFVYARAIDDRSMALEAVVASVTWVRAFHFPYAG